MNIQILELAQKFKALKEEHAKEKAILDGIAEQWDACEVALLEAMVEEGVNSIDIEGLGKFSMRTENYLSVNAANTEQFYEYLKETGNGGLLKEYVNPRTLTSWLKEHLAAIIEKGTKEGKDTVEARESALQFLNSKGASYFTKRGIQLRNS